MIPVLKGKNITLRGFTWADFPAFADMWQEPEVAQFIPFAPVEVSQSWSRFNGNSYRWATQGFGNWAVVDAKGVFLGTTGFFRRDGANPASALESGWVFAGHSHGRGVASEAAILSHNWLDQQPFGGASGCMMAPDHTASIRVAEKAGYQLVKIDEDQWGSVQIMERSRP